LFKKLIQNTIIYSIAPYVASFSNLLILPIITKDLTEIDYGISGTITAYTGALSALSALGLSVILSNSFFKSRVQYKYLWRQIYGFLTIWNILYSVILGVFLYIFIPDSASENRLTIILLSTLPNALLGPSNFLGTYYYTFRQEALPIGLRTMIFGVLSVFLNLLFISHYKLGYMGWFYTSFIISLLTNFSFWYVLIFKLNMMPIFNFKRKTIIKALRISLPLIPHQYSYYLLSGSERLIMDQCKIDTGKIGEFNIGSMFSNYVSNIAQAASTSIGPVIMIYFREQKFNQARNLLFLYQAILLIVNFIICLWAKEAFYILIQNDILKETYDLALILIMSITFSPLFSGYYLLITFNAETKSLWRITFVAGLLCVVLNLIFLPTYGIFSSALIFFFAYAYRGLAGYYLNSFRRINKVKFYPIIWTIIIKAFTIIVYLLRNASIASKAAITLLILALLIGLYIKRVDLKKAYLE